MREIVPDRSPAARLAVRVRRLRALSRAARRGLQVDVALIDVREEVVVVQRPRLHEARRYRGGAVVRGVLDLAARRLAVERLLDAQARGAVVVVRREVGVAALVRGPGGPELEALGVVDR